MCCPRSHKCGVAEPWLKDNRQSDSEPVRLKTTLLLSSSFTGHLAPPRLSFSGQPGFPWTFSKTSKVLLPYSESESHHLHSLLPPPTVTLAGSPLLLPQLPTGLAWLAFLDCLAESLPGNW